MGFQAQEFEDWSFQLRVRLKWQNCCANMFYALNRDLRCLCAPSSLQEFWLQVLLIRGQTDIHMSSYERQLQGNCLSLSLGKKVPEGRRATGP